MNWLFLRGLGREQRHWGSFNEIFEKNIAGSRVHCLDLPGTGLECHRPSPKNISLITEDIRQRWLSLAKTQTGDWSILGISLGGMIALDWCSKHRDFDYGVVINSSARGAVPMTDRLQGPALLNFLKIGMTPKVFEKESAVLEITSQKTVTEHSHILSNWIDIAESHPVTLRNLSAQLFAAAQFETPSSILKTQLLILSSLEDRIVSPRCSEEIAKRLNSPLETHPTAGHDLPLDDPEWVCEKIKEKLNSFVG